MRNPGQPESGNEPAELAGRRWAFGPAVLDERSLELEVGGKAVRLERKPLEVLLYLLHHAGEVVTKDDLADALWPGRILTETVLTRCISLLRQALQDEARTLIRTVHGFGYRLVVDVRVEVPATDGRPPALGYRPGDHPPLRPQWKLVERLGTGGHGEAWLARHEKTGDARVFKFALDARSLTSLKREITLYRLLHDSLGPRAAVAHIFEWNLTEAPYFIEMEHVVGGNLLAWSETQGGLPSVPLAARIELAVRIAEALAAAHSVGALHKDLKPGNVLIRTEDGVPLVRLCDFGSGGVLDPQRLDALGITRQGFTKSTSDATSATPLYVAPEVIAGQPFTVQADIYSLGVLLYQLVAGDLRRALAPGWESDVPDELLREDIALAAAGNPAKRLSDATQLAERLRGLEARREARRAEVAAAERARRVREITQQLRRTRAIAALLLALTLAAIGGGITAHQARKEALAATATTRAVNGFLTEDVLKVNRTVERPEGDSFEAVLDRAASAVDERFGNQPEAAATVHWLLGRRYQELQAIAKATKQYEHAADLFGRLQGPDAVQTMLAKERLASIYADHGRPQDARKLAEELRTYWLGADSTQLSTLLWRARIAKTLMFVGEYASAEHDLRTVLAALSDHSVNTADTKGLSEQWIGAVPGEDKDMPKFLLAHANDLLSALLGQLGDRYEEAEERARISLAVYEGTGEGGSDLIAFTRLRLGAILYYRAKYDEAEAHFEKARDFYDNWLPAAHNHRGLPRFWLGLVQLERQRPKDAIALLEEARSYCHNSCPVRVLSSYLRALGRAYHALGSWQDAVNTLTKARALATQIGFRHVLAEAPTIDLAESLRAAGRHAEAEKVLNEVSLEVLAALPNHQVRADYLLVRGKLNLNKGQFVEGAASLREAARILELRLGTGHWRTRLIRNELKGLKLGREP